MSSAVKYAQAIKEIETIIGQLKSDDVDVDELTAKTQKALSLIKFCNEKIKNTEFEVKKILEEVSRSEES